MATLTRCGYSLLDQALDVGHDGWYPPYFGGWEDDGIHDQHVFQRENECLDQQWPHWHKEDRETCSEGDSQDVGLSVGVNCNPYD